ncbi:MAG: PAS domain S-box protein, partial [Halobacteriaceae archaeon]
MAERHPRGDRPWRVRLSVGERNAGLLADWLAEREEYEHAEGSVDLWVVDPPGLREHADRIAAARAESDCYLPVLLVVPGRADGGGGTERTAALDRLDRDDLVDDVVETPTTGHELGRRFRTLLRARALSVEVTERERQYRELVETLPEAILIVRDGMVVYANEAAERLAGADADDLRGRGVESLFDAADRSAVAETVEAVEREGRAGEFVEVTVRDEGGAPVECDLTGVEVTYGDGPAVQLVVRDLSEQRER